NEQVRFALGIPQRYNCLRWYEMPHMTKIADAGCYTAEDMKLCDVLHVYNDKNNHVALITDFLRDDDGKIVRIEVSEAAIPFCKRADYDLETFFTKYKSFSLCRWELLEETADYSTEDEELLFSEAAYIRTIPDIAVSFGDRANILAGEEVTVSVFTEGACKVEITRDGEPYETISFPGKGKVTRVFGIGSYTFRHSVTGAETSLRVNAPKIEHTVADGVLNVKADPMDKDSELIYMDFRGDGKRVAGLKQVCHLTDEERASGIFSRKIHKEAATFKLYYRNPNGIWTTGLIRI
nr:hypothetical protein [Clostridia bacterium]